MLYFVQVSLRELVTKIKIIGGYHYKRLTISQIVLMTKNLRIAHVKNIFKAFLNGEWIPPVFVTPEGEVLDGQHRIAAFRMLKEKYPDSKAALPMMVVNVDESALLSAIKFNSGHANWVIEDYMRAHLKKGIHGYEQLRDFLKAYPEFEIKAAIQLIKGKYCSKKEL